MFSKKVVTLSIETNSVRVLVLRGKRVDKWGSLPLATGLVRDGLILQPAKVADCISALLRETGIHTKKVVLGISGTHSAFCVLDLPSMKPALMEEAVQYGAKKEMPVPLEELYLTWQRLRGSKNEQQVFVLGVPRDNVDAEIKTLSKCGIKVAVMGLKPLALTKAINCRNAVVIDLEHDNYGVTLVAEGIPVIMRAITPRREHATLEDNIRRLTDEVSRTVGFYNRSHSGDSLGPNTPVFLTGELADNSLVTQLIEETIEYPIEPLQPPVKYTPEFPAALYAANIGLRYIDPLPRPKKKAVGSHFHDVNVNILPQIFREQMYSMGYLFLFLAVMIAIAGVLPTYQANARIESKTEYSQAELDRIIMELRKVRLGIEEDQKMENAIAQIMSNVAALEEVSRSFVVQKSELGKTMLIIKTSLPTSAGLTSVDLLADQITLHGKTDSSSIDEVVDFAKALELEGIFDGVFITALDETDFTIVLN